MTVQPIIHAWLGQGAGHPVNNLPTTKQNQIGYSSNSMPSWSDWISIGIQLGYSDVTLTGNLLENRCDRSTWTTPWGPEIYQYPLVTTSYYIEVRISRIYYLTQRLTHFSRVITILSICVFPSLQHP